MINKAILVGNLGKDPEEKYANNGTAISNFNIATSEKWGGEEKTEWHRIVAFGKLAEICNQYLKRGKQVYIEGRIQTRDWEDRGGNKRYTTEIVANTMKMLSGSAQLSTGEYQESESNKNKSDDIPF